MGLRFFLCLIILLIKQAIAVFGFTKRVNFFMLFRLLRLRKP